MDPCRLREQCRVVRELQTADDGLIVAGRGDTAMTLAAIDRNYRQNGYLLDPHTAVGVAVAEKFLCDVPTVCLATAHPAKFAAAISQAVGEDIARHPTLEALKQLPVRKIVLKPELSVIEGYMKETLQR